MSETSWKSPTFYCMHQGIDMTLNYSLTNLDIQKAGFIVVRLDLPSQWRLWRERDDYRQLDLAVGEELKEGGLLHQQLASVGEFTKIEHILALRCSSEDEDGIWHDDGSRNFAFSLGLNLDPKSIVGGELNFRKKGSTETQSFCALAFGEMVIFLTGVWGYEHQVSQVTKGQRLVAAGWCS